MAANAAVVIPVYKETLDDLEKISLAQVKKFLGNYQIIFVAPQSVKIPYATQGNKIYYIQPQFFQSKKTYNLLMMEPSFYKIFLEYEYILIYQLDAFVFSDKLKYFCSLGYDYIGAAWPFTIRKGRVTYHDKIYKPRVGNGGFSLRKVEAFYNFLTNHKDFCAEMQTLSEDVFFSFIGKLFPDEFRVAPINIASKFAFEHCAEHFVNKNGGELPFGCHAWSFLNGDFAIKNFLKFGYDLKPLRAKMGNASEFEVNLNLTNYAMKRFSRRLQRGQSITRYLPQKKFASIRVVRNPLAMIIFTRLMLENPALSDEVFFYNEDEKDILLQDLKSARTPHLLVTALNEDALIEEFSKRGVTYGKRIISFQKEYMNYCKNLFKNLGK